MAIQVRCEISRTPFFFFFSLSVFVPRVQWYISWTLTCLRQRCKARNLQNPPPNPPPGTPCPMPEASISPTHIHRYLVACSLAPQNISHVAVLVEDARICGTRSCQSSSQEERRGRKKPATHPDPETKGRQARRLRNSSRECGPPQQHGSRCTPSRACHCKTVSVHTRHTASRRGWLTWATRQGPCSNGHRQRRGSGSARRWGFLHCRGIRRRTNHAESSGRRW